MNVLLYAEKHTANGDRLKRSIETLASLEALTGCWNFAELAACLQTPAPLPATVVLQAANREELKAFEAFRFRLEQVFFILVLPDADAETVACGHRLRPRFIAYHDSDFSEVCAVLDRFEARRGRNVSGIGMP